MTFSVKLSLTTFSKQNNSPQDAYMFLLFFFFLNLAALTASCDMQDLLVEACELLVTTYGIRLSWGIEPGVLELGVQSLSHWTTREVQMSVS